MYYDYRNKNNIHTFEQVMISSDVFQIPISNDSQYSKGPLSETFHNGIRNLCKITCPNCNIHFPQTVAFLDT